MLRIRQPALSFFSLLGAFLPVSSAIELSQFQAVTGFPQTCMNAYNTPISGCQASDFTNGAPCSSDCIASLQTLTTVIDSACAGSQADPSTLIGMFFVGKGVSTLCPNAASSASSSSSSSSTSSTSQTSSTQPVVIGSSTMVAPGYLTTSTSSVTAVSGSSSASSSSVSLSSGTQSSPSATSAASSAQSSSVPQSISSPSPTSSVSRPTFAKTAINQGSATVLTSKADQTGSSNPDAFGGGGSPFEVSKGAKIANSVSFALVTAVFGALGIIWLS